MSVKFLAHENNNMSLMGFEPIRTAILKLQVQRVVHADTLS
jgi:hypothetical protein